MLNFRTVMPVYHMLPVKPAVYVNLYRPEHFRLHQSGLSGYITNPVILPIEFTTYGASRITNPSPSQLIRLSML